jgi:hypothetical protein
MRKHIIIHDIKHYWSEILVQDLRDSFTNNYGLYVYRWIRDRVKQEFFINPNVKIVIIKSQ